MSPGVERAGAGSLTEIPLDELPASSRHTPLQPPRIVPPDTRPVAGDSARLVTLLVFAIVFGAGVLTITPHPLGVFSDDGMYAVLARSLSEGRGYRFINLPGAPSGTHFPPVYPLLLAAIWKIFPAFPQNVLVFKGINALLNALAAVLAFRLGERALGLPRWLAATAAVMGGVAIPSVLLAGMVLSEPLFLVLLLGALPVAERLRLDPTMRRALIVGAVGGIMMLTRSIGIAFVVGTIAALLLARHWRHAVVVAAAAAVFVVPWQRWVAAHDTELPMVLRGKYGSYTGWLARGVEAHGSQFLVETLSGNLKGGARMTVEPLRPPRVPGSIALAMVAGAVVLAVGGWRVARRAPVSFLVVGAYVGVVMLWPFDPTRFLWGIWPVFLLLVAAAIAQLLPVVRGTRAAESRGADDQGAVRDADRFRMPRRAFAVAGIACALVLALGSVAHTVVGYQKGWYSSLAVRRERTALPVLEWVLASTKPGDVVASDEESMVFLYTGRLGMPVTRFTPDEHLYPPSAGQRAADLVEILDRYQPDWVVTTAPISVAGARALMESTPQRLVVVDTLPSSGLVLRPASAK
jgi:hypothetical protein